MSTTVPLPIADGTTVRARAGALLRRHKRALAGALALHALAAVAAVIGPRLLGAIVEQVRQGGTTAVVDRLALLIAVAVIAQTVLTRAARRTSFVVAETVFAELREDFLARVLALPLSSVERAGTGDLVTRATADVDTLARTVRFAVPETLVATATTTLIMVAAFLTGPLVALPLLAGVPLLVIGTRWYLHRAPAGYLRERASYARYNGSLAETAEGARTVEALGLAGRAIRRIEDDLRAAFAAERYTLWLRTIWFPTMELAYVLPVAASLGWGGWLVANDLATLGQVTTVTLYAVQLVDPVDRLVSWLDEIQVGAASLARVLGVGLVPADRTPSGAAPAHERVEASGVRFAYRSGRDVLHGIDVELRPGERLAVVGPSGAGKSTLGRLLAGIHPPRTGEVTVGAVPLVDLPLDTLRAQVLLVTQEQHVFVGTVADNLRLARPDAADAALWRALAAVDADGWVRALPESLDTAVGSGGHPLSPARAQQLALARIVLADPHTLVLDEATSLLDPRAARHLEGSLAAVLRGRTVVAIAHRLHTAHDADRVAVIDEGLVSELGSHAELMAADGAYAALWRSWRSAQTAQTPSAQPSAATASD